AVRGGPRRAGVAPEPHRRRGADGRAEGPNRPRAGRRARPGAAGGPRRPVAPPPAPGRDDAAPRRRARAGRAGAGEERAGRARGARRARPGRGSVMSVPLFPRSAAGLLGCLAAVVNGVLRVAIVPVFVTPLFDRVLQAEDPAALPGVLAVAALVAVGGSLALWAQDALLGRAAARLAADWRRRLYRALLDGPPGRLPGSSGGLASRIVNDLREVETYYRYGLGTLVAESVTLVLILVLLVRADALAALALLALALPSVLALRWVGGYLERAADRSMAQSEAVGRHLQEGLKHHELVRAFGARRFMQARFEPANRAVERAMSQRSLIAGLQTPLTQVLVFGAIGVLVVFLVNGVQRGSLTIGDVIAFLTLVALAATPTQLLPHGYAHYRQARAAAERLARLAAGDAEPGSDPATGAVG